MLDDYIFFRIAKFVATVQGCTLSKSYMTEEINHTIKTHVIDTIEKVLTKSNL